MKKYRVLGALFGALIILGLFAAALSAAPGPQRYIIVFDDAVNAPARDAIITNVGGAVLKNLSIINGKAVLLPNTATAGILGKRRGVVSVEKDRLVKAYGKPAPAQPAEQLPWGVDRIDADLAWPTTAGAPVKVGVIDTGIDLDHPDLAVNIKGNVNMIRDKSGDDDNGHGTHVAGTIAGIDNSIGVIGVAPRVDLYAIKVLDRNGSGWLSDVIEGLDWAVTHNMDVVNMSLGSSSDVQAFREAVTAAGQAGVVQVAAAGNDYGGPVGYPAAYPDVIAVSASTDLDQIASFSSVGPEVDFIAPGAKIYSTYKDATYRTLNGTSMASPHVAGAAALVLSVKPAFTPADVKARLAVTADVLSGLSTNQQGNGLVDAQEAVLAP